MKYAMKNELIESETDFDVKKLNCEEKEKVLQYMRSVEDMAVSGLIFDCVSKEMTNKENLGFEKDGFIWTSSDIYHFEKYDAELNDEFYKMVMEKTI